MNNIDFKVLQATLEGTPDTAYEVESLFKFFTKAHPELDKNLLLDYTERLLRKVYDDVYDAGWHEGSRDYVEDDFEDD